MSNQPLVANIQNSILPLEDLTGLVNGKENMLEKLDVLYLHVENQEEVTYVLVASVAGEV